MEIPKMDIHTKKGMQIRKSSRMRGTYYRSAIEIIVMGSSSDISQAWEFSYIWFQKLSI
jgi:hypothetical protein